MKTWLLYVLLWVGGSAATPTERDVKVVGNTYGSVLVGDTVEVKYRPDIEKSEVLSEDICLHAYFRLNKCINVNSCQFNMYFKIEM